jgi:hypothetical protein
MTSRPPLSGMTADQLRERAGEYRSMAATATTAPVRDSLLRLAEQMEALVLQRAESARRDQ